MWILVPLLLVKYLTGSLCSPKDMLKSKLPVPKNVTLFGNRVFANIIKDLTASWIFVTILIMVGTKPRQKRRHWEVEGRRLWKERLRLDLCWHRPRNARRHQKLEKARKDFPLESFGGYMALPTLRLQTSGLHNSERINFCCLKSPSLW